MSPASCAEQGLDVNIVLLFLTEFQQCSRFELEFLRYNHIGKLLNAHIIYIDCLVVKFTPVSDRILEAGDSGL